jgi:hypothetical protein
MSSKKKIKQGMKGATEFCSQILEYIREDSSPSIGEQVELMKFF